MLLSGLNILVNLSPQTEKDALVKEVQKSSTHLSSSSTTSEGADTIDWWCPIGHINTWSSTMPPLASARYVCNQENIHVMDLYL